MIVTEKTQCRNCHTSDNFESVINLGNICTSDFIQDQKDALMAPLDLVVCKNCRLVQLRHTVNQDKLYKEHYWYQSGLNASMVDALQNIVTNIEEMVTFESNDYVYDIGCNDGTLLSLYKNKSLYKIGFDPAVNLAYRAKQFCNEHYADYFKLSGNKLWPKAKVVTSIAMFYDLDDPNDFIKDVKNILKSDGIWVVQFTDLLSMFSINAVDNICHEHLEYYSLEVLQTMFLKHDLDIFHVSKNEVNGGSIRAYVCHRGTRPIDDSVLVALNTEQKYMRKFENPFLAFGERVAFEQQRLMSFLKKEKMAGKSIYVMGASTKGNTLLQYYGIDNTLIEFAAEVNPDKYGLKTVGTNIPIISETEALAKQPDYFLILPWHFADMLYNKHSTYIHKGGKIIVPLPIFRILG